MIDPRGLLIDFQAQHQSLLTFSLIATVAYLFWRAWRFSLITVLHPTMPKELPYWVPILGHASDFFLNSYRVLDRGREHFGISREPYSITIMGQNIYVITSPEGVQSLYKSTDTLSWLHYVQQLYEWIGVSKPKITRMFNSPTLDNPRKSTLPKDAPYQKVLDYRHHHLLPGDSLEKISHTFRDALDEGLRWHNLTANDTYRRGTSSEGIRISLLDWTTEVFVQVVTEIYWGKGMLRVAPHIVQSLRKWERCSWKYLYNLPSCLRYDTDEAKHELLQAFTSYFELPESQRMDAMSPVTATEEELRTLSFHDGDIARVNMLWHWAINGNLHKVTFWVIAYLLHNPNMLRLVLGEVRASAENGEIDLQQLTERCPWIEAVYHEVLRLKAGSSLMRDVTEDTVIGGKTLKKGNKVMVQYRQLHFNGSTWGEDYADFRPARFIKNRELARSTSYKPFGGGQNLCPGRFLARQVIFTFVALVLLRYDINLADEIGGGKQDQKVTHLPRFPRTDESRPGLGTLSPVKGDDVFIHLQPRRV